MDIINSLVQLLVKYAQQEHITLNGTMRAGVLIVELENIQTKVILHAHRVMQEQ